MNSSENMRYNDGLVLQTITVECSNVVDWSEDAPLECSDSIYLNSNNIIIISTFIGVKASWTDPGQHFREQFCPQTSVIDVCTGQVNPYQER